MKEKNILILGGTSGVGKAMALDLARNQRVLIVGRSREKALSVVTEASSGLTDFVLGDLANPADLARVVAEIPAKIPVVDVIFDTFGVFPSSAEVNVEVNLVAHAQILRALRPLMAVSARIFLVTGNPQALQLPICENQSAELLRAAWEISHKTLLMTLLASEFAASGITVNSFFPGDVQSDLMPWTRSLTNTQVPVGRYLALSADLENVTGQMFDQGGKLVNLPEKYNFENAQQILAAYGL